LEERSLVWSGARHDHIGSGAATENRKGAQGIGQVAGWMFGFWPRPHDFVRHDFVNADFSIPYISVSGFRCRSALQ
jgi:hypothetical protein